MPKRSSVPLVLALIAASGWVGPVLAQDVRPLAPVVVPAERVRGGERDDGEGEPELVPLPEVPSRAAAASRDRVRMAVVLPVSWTRIAERYQPSWAGVTTPRGFGVHSWDGYFALSGVAPALAPHPFFAPWGIASYEGWLYERYRDVWSTSETAGLLAEASTWLQRGDRLMLVGRPRDAVLAYRRVTQTAPDFPLGYLGIGAAFAELGEDEEAARAFRQGFERYPAWLGLAIDWERLFASQRRLEAALKAAAERGERGATASRFVAGVLHLFGGRVAEGQQLLNGLAGDPHASRLVAQGPR